jgi:hypothetical protein
MNGFFTRIGLTEVNMQWAIPNVNERNSTLLLERGAAAGVSTVTESFTVDIGTDFYTPNELAATIQNQLRILGAFDDATWTVTWSEQDNIFRISTNDPTIVFRIRPQNQGASDDLCNLMGFSYPSSQFAPTVIGSYASMQYTPYFDIVSNNLTKKQNVRDNGTSFLTGQNLLARVYLSESGISTLRDRTPFDTPPQLADCNIVGCRPFNLYREYQTPKQIYWDTEEFINVIDLRLIDYKGNTLFSTSQAAQQPASTQTNSGDASQFQLTMQITET